MNRFIKFFIAIFLLFNILFFGVILYPSHYLLDFFKPIETVKIVDRYDTLLYEVLNEKGRQTFLSFSEVPDHLKNAFLSVEDRRFYEHSGVDSSAILRAIWDHSVHWHLI